MFAQTYKTHLYCLFFACLLVTKTSPLNPKITARVNATISCRDCDYIPKVSNAGQLLDIDGIQVQIMHNGVYVMHGAYHGDWMSKIIKELKGHHEPQEEKVFYETLKTLPTSATMIELGSYWSYYSMWFNKAIPDARNYMIEPNPTKLTIGEKHFALNNMLGTFLNAFLGKNSDLDATFSDWDGKQYKIPKVCIDDFVKENNIDFIHMLHSDIQGAEYDMLLGCKETILSGKVGYVFISTHGDCHPKCLDFLTKANFHIIAQHSIKESYSADGLIVARHKNFPGLDRIEISKNH